MEPSELSVAGLAMQLPSQEWVTPMLSFEELFADEAEPMIRLAMTLVDSRERAEEIVQDAFEKTLVAWRRVHRPGAYLRSTVVNGCRSELRRRRVVRRHSDPTGEGVTSETDTYMLDAVAKLTPQRRIALTLRFYADLPEAESAMRWACDWAR